MLGLLPSAAAATFRIVRYIDSGTLFGRNPETGLLMIVPG